MKPSGTLELSIVLIMCLISLAWFSAGAMTSGGKHNQMEAQHFQVYKGCIFEGWESKMRWKEHNWMTNSLLSTPETRVNMCLNECGEVPSDCYLMTKMEFNWTDTKGRTFWGKISDRLKFRLPNNSLDSLTKFLYLWIFFKMHFSSSRAVVVLLLIPTASAGSWYDPAYPGVQQSTALWHPSHHRDAASPWTSSWPQGTLRSYQGEKKRQTAGSLLSEPFKRLHTALPYIWTNSKPLQ